MIQFLFRVLNLDSSVKATCTNAIQQFEDIVLREPLGVTCRIGEISDSHPFDEKKLLDFDDYAMLMDYLVDVFNVFPRESIQRRFVFVCPTEHRLAQITRASNNSALSGGSNGMISVVYEHDPAIIWHEMFHLIGAGDCYDETNPRADAVPKCGNLRCIMQYHPTVLRCGFPPFLCSKNVADCKRKCLVPSQ